jgi:hypothetical protein
MILEGLVTTLNADGTPHVTPMGPDVSRWGEGRFTLKPFGTSTTAANLARHGEGVLHVTDDVLVLARAAVNAIDGRLPMISAVLVNGVVLKDACRAYEFRVVSRDDTQPRHSLDCEIVHTYTLREFFGFNRAKHAVLEAAILATRVHMIPVAEIEAEFAKLRIIVNKTGGPREHTAMAFLEEDLRRPR